MYDTTALTGAISGVETATANLSTADQAQATAQKRYDDAKTAKDQADTADASAVLGFNAALDTLIQAATSAKLTILPPEQPAPPAA